MTSRENKLRAKIFKLVKDIYRLRVCEKHFVPGQTRIPYAGRVYDEKEMIAAVDSSLDFWLTLGRYGDQFAKDISAYLKCRYAVLANSGSSANLLAVSALTSPLLKEKRLKPGDEVLTLAASFPTTVAPIIQNRLVPVFVDIALGTYNVDPGLLERAIGKKTRAIFMAHTLGNPFDLAAVMRVARKHGLFLIEDACDALGATYRGKRVGTFGHMGTLSFYPAHHITTGEGGAVVTNDRLFKRILESLRDWGRDCWCAPGQDNTCGCRFSWKMGSLPKGYDHKYIYSHLGYNMKPVDMAAAVGVAQLKKLPGFIALRRRNFKRLYDELKKYEEYLILPQATKESRPSWFGFLIGVKTTAPFTKDQLVAHLEKNCIATRPLFAGNILRHPAFEGMRHRVNGGLKNTDFVMNRVFWIGVYPGLDDKMIRYIHEAFSVFMAPFNKG